MNHPDQHTEHDGLEVFFSKYLKDASMEPSAGSWEMIDQALKAGEKEKRRRRFLWIFFSGAGALLLLGTWLFFTYGSPVSSFFAPAKQTAAAPSSAPVNIGKNTSSGLRETTGTKETAGPADLQPATNAAHESTVSSPDEVFHSENNITHVQLGAFKHPARSGMFNKLPFAVYTETSSDGLARYYARTGNPEKDLELIRRSGFKDAFIKKEPVNAIVYHDAPSFNKEEGKISYSAKTEKQTATSGALPAITQSNNKTGSDNNPAETKLPAHGSKKPVENDSNKNLAANQTKPQALTASKNTAGSVASNTQALSSGTKEQNTSTEGKSVGQQTIRPDSNTVAAVTPTVSAALTETVVTSADSARKEPDKKDSTQRQVSSPHKDSNMILPYARWAISLTGGPNVFFNSPSSTAFSVKHEYHPQTYNVHLGVEYRFMPTLSGVVGVSYQEYSTRQDETYFKFSKYISNDYMVQTSGGPIPIDKDILLQGFYMAAPIDSFFAYYTYAYTQRMVNVPLHLNWYFINKPRIQAYAGLGVNASYLVAQQNRVTLIKEHDRRDLNYNHINGNRFNALLLLSLGCDVRFSKRFYFTAAPTLRYGLTNTSNTPGVLFRPFYLSGNAGLKFRF